MANAYLNSCGGSGAEYPADGIAAPGSSAEIIEVSPHGEWWIVKPPTTISPDGIGWVSDEYVNAFNSDQIAVPEVYVQP